MQTIIRKGFSLFFALTLLFSPLAGPVLTPKVEAQLGGAIASCIGGYVAGLVGSFLSFLEVPVGDGKNNVKECLDAIAFALAKTLLAKLTDSIINWINTGFEGNPFYIGDSGNFFKNVIEDELQIALDDIKRTGNLYFDIIRQEAIYNARKTLRDEIGFTLDADIVSGICGYAQYEAEEFCRGQLTQEARSELTHAFTSGYLPFQWSTWDSLTQNCGNNIFCANTSAAEYALYQRQERVTQLNTELNRSGGFLDKKVCKDPGYQRDLEEWKAEVDSYSIPQDDDFMGPPQSSIDPSTLPPRPVCDEMIIQTPGRVIADKLTSNLGTSERQLELADELNESIAAIFNALIEKLIADGLNSFNGSGNDDSDDSYYQQLNSENSGFDFDSTSSVLEQDPEACDVAGGTYDEELEVCDFEEESEPTNGPPQFPWTFENGLVVQDDRELATLINQNLGVCIEIDEVRIVEGTEPCLIGISSDEGEDGTSSSGTLVISPEPLLVGTNGTYTISDAPADSIFEILYLLEDASTAEFLTSGVTDGDGSGSTSTTTPNITANEVTIIIDFEDDDTDIEQVVQISR